MVVMVVEVVVADRAISMREDPDFEEHCNDAIQIVMQVLEEKPKGPVKAWGFHRSRRSACTPIR